MKLKIVLNPSEKIPKNYGLAYYHYESGTGVCMPVPINIICRFFWIITMWCKNPMLMERRLWATIPPKIREEYERAKYREIDWED